MNPYHVTIEEGPAFDNRITVNVMRQLDKAESEALREMLRNAFDAGYDNCRDERDRQEKDPNYPLHRRNPYDGREPCTESCCTSTPSVSSEPF